MEYFAGTKQLLLRIGFAKLTAMSVVILAVIGAVVWVAARSGAPTGLLYSGLDPAEAGRVAQHLDEMKVPYAAKGDGSVILVPASQVARVRMELAAAGLPRQSGAGYELLDSQSPMNMTSFMQRVQRLRALEGELARTIATLNGVRSARVHLVMAERESFSLNTPKPTASVTVVMFGPTRLSTAQAAAIRLLVAGAVPSLQEQDVSVLDPSGIVLAANGSDALAGGRLGELKTNREHSLERSVIDLLEPLVGSGKVRVVASVDLDETREVAREEKFDPLSQVERSKQTDQSHESSDETQPRDPVSVAQNLPNQQPQEQSPGGAPAKTSSSTTHNGETINYEISSVRSERVREPGAITRLTVAVVIDGTVDAKGDYQPRSPEELSRLSELVRSAVGFDAKRGDQVTIETHRFVAPEALGTDATATAAPDAIPRAWLIAAGVVPVLGLGAWMLLRRGRTRIEPARTTTRIAASQALTDEAAAVPALTPETKALVPYAAKQPDAVTALLDLVDRRPDEVLSVIRAWIADSPAI
jgi:flagellar M-ring protein FliF